MILIYQERFKKKSMARVITFIAGSVGRKTLYQVDHILNLMAFTIRIITQTLNAPKEGRLLVGRAIVEQIYFTYVQALWIIVPVSLLIGTTIIVEACLIQQDLGKIIIMVIIREVGPMVTALVIVLRSATAVTVEIGYMKVRGEMEAIEMAGIDPLRLICFPRLVGISSAVLFLFIVFDFLAITGSSVLVQIFTDLPVDKLMISLTQAISMTDIFVGLIKALLFGIIITMVCLYNGFIVEKSITSVAIGTSKASLECFLYILVTNIIISAVFL